MSSIAYVTDENMAEYFRLCGSREINFWRLSARGSFRSFKPGDLLFFYTRKPGMRTKGLLGYAHFKSSSQLSVKQMWNRYGKGNGYETIEQLKEAIRKAARDREVPVKLNCLYLTDVVFFNDPVLPKDVGIHIDKNLESYQYLDKDDPTVTIRILQAAHEKGIDIWSVAQNYAPESVFRDDEIRQKMALICKEVGKGGRIAAEERQARKLAKARVTLPGWHYIHGSNTDCMLLDDGVLHIAVPFTYKTSDKAVRLKEWMGTICMYRLKIEAAQLPIQKVVYEVISENEEEELLPLLKVLNK